MAHPTRLATILLLLTAGTAVAAPNANLNVRGLQIGAVTRVLVTGSELADNPRLISSLAFKQKRVGAVAANRVEFDVTLPKSARAGIYNFWLVTDSGVSKKLLVAVDHLPQKLLTPMATLPVSLHGQITGSQTATTSFMGKKGQLVMVAVEAQRLDSRLRPVLQLFDGNNRLLAWTLPKPQFRGDARIRATLPRDGKYRIQIHDLEYAGRAPGFYRLKMGTWKVHDIPYPPVVRRGTDTKVQLIGGNGWSTVKASSSGSLVPINAGSDSSGPQSFVSLTDRPVAIEPMARAKSKTPLPMQTVPSVACGRILERNEVDTWQVPVKAGTKVRLRLVAQPLGSALDGFVTVRADSGKTLGASDDVGNSADCQLDVTVPKGVKQLLVDVSDRNRLGGTHFVYQLTAEPIVAASPNFSLQVDNFGQAVSSGNRTIFRVLAQRSGYNGPIQLRFDNLPAGVQTQAPTIPAGGDGVLVTLNGAGSKSAAKATRLVGSAVINGKRIERPALDGAQPVRQLQPWLQQEMLVSLGNPNTPVFDAVWSPSTANARSLVLGKEVSLRVRGFRPVGSDGPIRFSIISSQRPILNKKRQLDAGRMVRLVRGTELAANKAAQVAFDAVAKLRKPLKTAQAKSKAIQARTQKVLSEANQRIAKANALIAAASAPIQKLQPQINQVAKEAQTQTRINARINEFVAMVRTDNQMLVAKHQQRVSNLEGLGPPQALIIGELGRRIDSLKAAIKTTKDAKTRGVLQGQLAALQRQATSIAKSVGKAADLPVERTLLALAKEAAAARISVVKAKLNSATERAIKLKASRDKLLAELQRLTTALNKVKAEQGKIVTAAKLTIALAQAERKSAAAELKAAQDKFNAAQSKANQTARLANHNVDVVVAVPASLPKFDYMLTLQAQLLSRDKKRVLATRTLPVRQLEVIRPFTVAVNKRQWSGTLIKGKATVVTVTGMVERRGGFVGAIGIAASGLPKGGKASGSAPANSNRFTLTITLPANQKPGKLNLNVVGTSRFTNKLPVVRGLNRPITLTLAAANKPAKKK